MSSATFSYLLACILMVCSHALHSQQPFSKEELSLEAHQAALRSLEEFKEMLAIPNDAHYPDQVEANVAWTEAAFAARGFKSKRLITDGPPLLIAELPSKDFRDTVLVYLQMDGQPVDSSFWRQPNPYNAVLKREVQSEGWQDIAWSSFRENWNRNDRIFARSTSDAKGPVMMFLAAMDVLNQQQKAPPFALKVIIDFEEELGSPHLPDAVRKYQNDLRANHLIIFDGPMHPSNQPTLAFGARGITTVTLETFGPRRPQHSGHYGNYSPNPAWDLIHLLAPLKTDDGRVTLDGWYDGITIDNSTKAILDAVPDDVKALLFEQAIGRVDAVGASLQEALQYPSLNIRGIGSGWIREERRTIIPATALVEIDIRTVVESDPAKLLSKLKQYLIEKGCYLVEGRQPSAAEKRDHPRVVRWDAQTSYQAFRTPLSSSTGEWLTAALTHAHGKPPVRIRTMGGSIPISPFVNTLGIPAVSVPTVNSDNNQHSPNENIRLGNYEDGIRSMLAILSRSIE